MSQFVFKSFWQGVLSSVFLVVFKSADKSWIRLKQCAWQTVIDTRISIQKEYTTYLLQTANTWQEIFQTSDDNKQIEGYW